MAADPNIRMSREEAKRAVGTSIRRNRQAFGMSQRDLALMAGVSEATISGWERGLYEPGSYSLDIVRSIFKTKARERQAEAAMAASAGAAGAGASVAREAQ